MKQFKLCVGLLILLGTLGFAFAASAFNVEDAADIYSDRSSGWQLMPDLPLIMKNELGGVTLDGWRYYANRLTLPASMPEAIRTLAELESAMAHWKTEMPERPYGETETLPSYRSPGWDLIPHLGYIIEENLGREHVTFQVWRYYADRLTLDIERAESIRTGARLNEVMEYWLLTQPEFPRGRDVLPH